MPAGSRSSLLVTREPDRKEKRGTPVFLKWGQPRPAPPPIVPKLVRQWHFSRSGGTTLSKLFVTTVPFCELLVGACITSDALRGTLSEAQIAQYVVLGSSLS